MLFEREGDKIVCLLCRHYCHLKEGQVGFCGVNRNSNATLENLTYGRVSAINIDPIEKKPLYHFLPDTTSLSIGTVGCNFRCPFCQNWEISQSKNIDSLYQISPEQIVALALERGSKTVSYTYNEPTIFWEFAKDTATIAKAYGLRNIFVSNGFESREIVEDMVGVIDAFNIDLKSFRDEYYRKVLKGNLNGVLDTLKLIKERGFWLEVTTLIVPEDNDSKDELRSIANFISKELGSNTPWHISAFFPNYKMLDKTSTPPKSLKKAYEIGKEEGLNFIYFGNIDQKSITYCPECGFELIVRDRFRVLKNSLTTGECPKCGSKIEGVWR
jgi:pyruvate formate lyase activating enzyme